MSVLRLSALSASHSSISSADSSVSLRLPSAGMTWISASVLRFSTVRAISSTGQTVFQPGLDGFPHGVPAVVRFSTFPLTVEQLAKFYLGGGLGFRADLHLPPTARGTVADVDGREPPLPRLLPVQAALTAAAMISHALPH